MSFPLVHRLVLLAFRGTPESPNADARHLDGCRTNNVPSNLAWGSRSDNMEDARSHGTLVVGSASKRSKLNEFKVRAMIALLVQGANQYTLGAMFKVSQSAVSNISKGNSWRHIPRPEGFEPRTRRTEPSPS